MGRRPPVQRVTGYVQVQLRSTCWHRSAAIETKHSKHPTCALKSRFFRLTDFKARTHPKTTLHQTNPIRFKLLPVVDVLLEATAMLSTDGVSEQLILGSVVRSNIGFFQDAVSGNSG